MSKRKLIILCIDDHEESLMARKLLLEEAGYEVLTALHGRTGLQLFIAHRVDTVILDCEMPEMNGDEVASQMKSLKPEVPILLLSGHSPLPEDKLEIFDACLSKGEPTVALLATIQQLISRSSFFDRWIGHWKHRGFEHSPAQELPDPMNH